MVLVPRLDNILQILRWEKGEEIQARGGLVGWGGYFEMEYVYTTHPPLRQNMILAAHLYRPNEELLESTRHDIEEVG